MLLPTDYHVQAFGAAGTPYNAVRVPGAVVRAYFVRTAFHDMASANILAGVGGLEGSIGFEIGRQYAVNNASRALNNIMVYHSQLYNSEA